MFIETSTTPSATISRRSVRRRPRSCGREIAHSAAEPKSSRNKTTPGGPSSGKSDFATAAPPCTEQAAPKTIATQTRDALALLAQRQRRARSEEEQAEHARPVQRDPLGAEEPEAVDRGPHDQLP